MSLPIKSLYKKISSLNYGQTINYKSYYSENKLLTSIKIFLKQNQIRKGPIFLNHPGGL